MTHISKITVFKWLGVLVIIAGLTNCRDGHQPFTPEGPKKALPGQKTVSYESVRPILMKACVECHKTMGQRDWSDKEMANSAKKDILKKIWDLKDSPLRMPQPNSPEEKGFVEGNRLALKAWAESPEPIDGGDVNTPGEGEVKPEPRDPVKEISMYDKMATSCFGCHDKHGVGGIEEAPHIAGLDKTYLINQLKSFRSFQLGKVSPGRDSPYMNGVAMSLTDEEIEFFADYYSKLDVEKIVIDHYKDREFTDEEEEYIERGRNYMAAGRSSCAGCHVGGRARATGAGMPSLAGQKPAVIEKEIRDFESGYRTNATMKAMLSMSITRQAQYEAASPDDKAKLDELGQFRFNDDHIKATALYLSALNPGEPMETQPYGPQWVLKKPVK